jgi:pimeloyl-ACP methyl ester carboxylesterase
MSRSCRKSRVTAAFAVGCLVVSSCSSSGESIDSGPGTGPASTDDVPDGSGDAGSGDAGSLLDWSPCDDGTGGMVSLECATLVVPRDHADPAGTTLDIAVARVVASGADEERIGSLVFNPGGPGGSGIESLPFIALTMSPALRDRFDLVSFDPRGVGASTALECDPAFDDTVTLLEEGDDAGWQELLESGEADLANCSDDTTELADVVGTNNAARDLDVLRAALGDDGLSYVGYSYGTRLGATYAELFPTNVRALVLDGAVKPTSDLAELNIEQGAGFDRALENFAAACDADEDCLLREIGPTLEVLAGLEAEIAEEGSFPTSDPDRVLTPGELSLGVAAALYSVDSWPFLAQALYLAEVQQDGSLLQTLGDSLLGRDVDGTYDNSQVANGFINCADDPSRPTADEQRELAAEAAERSAYFSEFLRADTGCIGIPAATDPLVLGPATDAPPIVVVGTTGDPATPYEWAVELADFLDTGVLYTVDGEGHTAYGSIACASEVLDAYLIDLTVPEEGASCSADATVDYFEPVGESEVEQALAFFDCLRDEGVEIPEVTTSDVLADPTLETVLGDLDLGDPAFLGALEGCSALLPEL